MIEAQFVPLLHNSCVSASIFLLSFPFHLRHLLLHLLILFNCFVFDCSIIFSLFILRNKNTFSAWTKIWLNAFRVRLSNFLFVSDFVLRCMDGTNVNRERRRANEAKWMRLVEWCVLLMLQQQHFDIPAFTCYWLRVSCIDWSWELACGSNRKKSRFFHSQWTPRRRRRKIPKQTNTCVCVYVRVTSYRLQQSSSKIPFCSWMRASLRTLYFAQSIDANWNFDHSTRSMLVHHTT